MATKKGHHKILLAVLATYLLMSFVPQIGILSLYGGMKGKKAGGGSGGKIL